jgi:hypothetical protein
LVADVHAGVVTVRPLRQMASGSSFDEVFVHGVRIPGSATLHGCAWSPQEARIRPLTTSHHRTAETTGPHSPS